MVNVDVEMYSEDFGNTLLYQLEIKLKVGHCFLCGFAPLRSLRETHGQFSKFNLY